MKPRILLSGGSLQSKMLGLMLVSLLMVLLAPVVLGFEFDNVKSYDEGTRTVTVKDSLLGIPTTTVATITLDTPLENYVMRGSDVLVAQFTVDNNEGTYTNALKEMELYDLKRNNWQVDKKFTYKYKVFTPYDEPVYSESCGKALANGSKNCWKEQTGTKQSFRESWQPLEDKDLPTGRTVVGIFTEVKAHDKYEWVPTLFGVRVQEWATWSDAYEVGLVMWYKFDEGTGTKAKNSLPNSPYNLTVVNNWTTGIIGNAYETSNTNIDTGYTGLGTTTQTTFNAWVKCAVTTGGYDSIISTADTATGVSNWGFLSGCGTYVQGYVGALEMSGLTMPPGSWFMLTLTIKNNEQVLYVNGTKVANKTLATSLGSDSVKIFGRTGAVIDGKAVDEIGVWNRSLSSGEVLDLFNNGSGLTYRQNVAPSAPVWNKPDNGTTVFASSYQLNWTNSTDAEGDTLTYAVYIDNNADFSSPEFANGSVAETATPTNIDVSGLADGTWFARVLANDGTVNSSWSTNLTFTQQSLLVVTNNSIKPGVVYVNGSLNCTAYYRHYTNLSGTVNLDWYVNDVFNKSTQHTGVENNTYVSSSLVSQLRKNENWSCKSNASAGGQTATYNSSVVVSNTFPSLPALRAPSNGSLFINDTFELSCVNSTDADGDTVFYEFYTDTNPSPAILAQNTSNTSYTQVSQANITYYWDCKANDQAGGVTPLAGQRNFVVNTTIISAVTPGYLLSIPSTKTVAFNFTVDYNQYRVLGLRSSFTFNYTNFTVKQSNVSSTRTVFLVNGTAPFVNADTNKTFYWDLIPTIAEGDGSNQRTNVSTLVSGSNVTTCVNPASGQDVLVNFSSYNEINTSSVAFDMNGYFTVWTTDPAVNGTVSVSETGKTTVNLCGNGNNNTMYVTGDLEYFATGFDLRNWFLRSLSVNTSYDKEYVRMYLVDEIESQVTRFVVTDDTETPLSGRKIHAQRKDQSTGQFFTVAMAGTDSQGEAYFPMEWYDATYKFLVYNPSNVLEFTTSDTVLQTTPVYIRISEEDFVDNLNVLDNVLADLSFSNTTKTFTLTFNDPSGGIAYMCMDVKRISAYVSNVTVCHECVEATSGTINCVVGDVNGVYTAVAFAKVNPSGAVLVKTWENLKDFGGTLGLSGVAYSMLLLMALGLMFSFSPTTSVVGGILGLVIIGFMGFSSLPYVAIISMAVAGAIAIGVMKS